MTASLPQGELGIERMCRLAAVSRAGYYRHWQASAPKREETGLRDAIQRLALAHRHYGYRRIAALLGREGWQANHKRVLRLMHEDNLLCLRKAAFVPATTDSRHGWRNCRREMKRRAAVEPVIGHLKAEHRLGRNYLNGPDGDRINAVLAAAGYNFSLLLRWLKRLLRALIAVLIDTNRGLQIA
jgi:hypothetical protein